MCENDVIDKIYRSCVKDDLDIAICDFYKYTNNQEIYVNDGIKMRGGIDKICL